MTALLSAPCLRRRWPVPAVLVLMLALMSSALHAQPVRGTLTDSTRLVPVAGVVVTLLDGSGASVARTLSSERGLYYFATRGNASSLRVQRIGYRAQTLPLPNAIIEITTLNVVMAKLPTLLAPMQVVDKGCPRRSDEGSALSLLEQARTGVLATVVASKEMPSVQTTIRYERVLEGTGDRIVQQRVKVDTAAVKTHSFESAHSAIDFVTRGFTETVQGATMFHAPDADVLLNDDFVAAYCFQLAKPERNRVNQVGLAFHAVRSVRNRVDVEGAMWIDTVARAIREIEFRYKGLIPQIEQLKPGGTIGFREMTSGVVLIDRWTLRLVGVELDTVQMAVAPMGVKRSLKVNERSETQPVVRNRLRVSETGGELARAVWPDGFTWDAPLATLTVHASTAKQLPAVGAMLRLANTNYGGVTDSAGTLRISQLIPGPYQLFVIDPRLSTIDVDIETPVKIVAQRDSTYTAAFRANTAEEYVAERCGLGRQLTDSRTAAWIAGRIVGEDKASVDSLKVTVRREIVPGTWMSVNETFQTGADGLFFICSKQLRPEMPVQLEFRRRGMLVQTLSGKLNEFLTILRIPMKPE